MIPFARIVKYGNTAPAPSKIKKIETGLNHVVVLGQSGDLYVRGLNGNGQLGLGDTTIRTSWTLALSSVQDVWCGDIFTIARKFDGTYWCTGYGYGYGVIGGGTTIFTDYSARFLAITSGTGTTIRDIKCDSRNTLVLRSDGTLWGIGTNTSTELGLPAGAVTNNFRQISTPTVPIKIFHGYQVFAYTDAVGDFYCCGILYGTVSAGSTTYTSFTKYSPNAGVSTVLDFHGTPTGSYFILQDASNNLQIYCGGSQFNGNMADGQNSNTTKPMGSVSSKPFSTPYYSIFQGFAYYSQHVVTSTGIFAAGVNSTPYAGKLGVGNSTSVLTYTQCSLSGVTDFSSVKVYHTYNKVFVLANDTLYSSGLDTTYSTTSSNTFIVDSPIS